MFKLDAEDGEDAKKFTEIIKLLYIITIILPNNIIIIYNFIIQVLYNKVSNFWSNIELTRSIFSRPIAGHANLCPKSIGTKPQELETLLSTVKHEILHALGFSLSLYAFYRDENGEPRTPRRSDTGKPMLNEK